MTEPTATVSKPVPSRWTARVGLLVAAVILVSCFGLLIAGSHAAQ